MIFIVIIKITNNNHNHNNLSHHKFMIKNLHYKIIINISLERVVKWINNNNIFKIYKMLFLKLAKQVQVAAQIHILTKILKAVIAL